MGKINRIRVRGKQRPQPDAALVAQAIIELGRELRAQEQQTAAKKPAPARPPQPPPAKSGEASPC